MSDPLTREREVAVGAARRAAAAILSLRAGYSVDFKDAAHDDPVTTADRAANTLLVEALSAAFPDDTIVAEESAVPADFARARRCWFVDPLDGTKEFVAGNGEYCVMVGLAVDGRAALGVVAVPEREGGYVLVGEPGRSAERWVGDQVTPLAVSSVTDRAAVRLLVSRSRTPAAVQRILDRLGARGARPCGSVGVKIGELALARADAYVHLGPGPKLWDLCAPDAILSAAGGCFTDTRGQPIRYQGGSLAHTTGVVATNTVLHAAVMDAVADL